MARLAQGLPVSASLGNAGPRARALVDARLGTAGAGKIPEFVMAASAAVVEEINPLVAQMMAEDDGADISAAGQGPPPKTENVLPDIRCGDFITVTVGLSRLISLREIALG